MKQQNITPVMGERLQKVLAQSGFGSRRQIEEKIRKGDIRVNGNAAELGCKLKDDDRVNIAGRLYQVVGNESQPKVLLYNKPLGEVCTRSDPEGRTTVFSKLPRLRNGRWITLGRLDINTTGLLLFSTDGDLAHALAHPSGEHLREYAVRVAGEVSDEQLKALSEGVMLEDGMARFLSIKEAGGTGVNHWYHVSLGEGRNREVRRLWESQGIQVSRLIRISFAGIPLPRDLRMGAYRDLEAGDLARLRSIAGLSESAPVELQLREMKRRRRN